MKSQRTRATMPRRTLATDLDGTLIPLDGSHQNRVDLTTLGDQLRTHEIDLVYVTGRDLDLIFEAVREHSLPSADWIISDVGTTLYERVSNTGGPADFRIVDAYFETLGGLETADLIATVRKRLQDRDGIRLQEESKQNRLKASFYANGDQIELIAKQVRAALREWDVNFDVIDSVDPFTGHGLLDIVPHLASKQFALEWWRTHEQREMESLLFAGDSGNDWHAFTAGYRTVVVANTERAIARRVYDWHVQHEWRHRLLLAQQPATSGVLEACHWFEWFPNDPEELATTIGVRPQTVNHCQVLVWAPHQKELAIVSQSEEPSREPFTAHLHRRNDGYHTGHVKMNPGDRYSFRMTAGHLRPDPTSRWQPDGVHGPSMVIDPNHFPWQDHQWSGLPTEQLAIYELHVGTFTSPGTYRALEARLDYFLQLGVNAIELMPLAQTPGQWNWGYDGVHLFAPRNNYGTPDDLRSLVDACHRRGLSVILDVVYNHLGPEGNYLTEFGPYFSSKHRTPWGESFAFDGPEADAVREYIVDNAIYWLRDFHLDGLRLDAVHFMRDHCPTHILEELRQRISQQTLDWKRHIHLIAESNVFDSTLVNPQEEAPLTWTIWCDDLMHAAHAVSASHETFAHREYSGTQDMATALKQGFLYAGEHPEQYDRVDIEAQGIDHPLSTCANSIWPFVIGLQNHDKVGNHPLGLRIHQLSTFAAQKTLAALFILYPAIPQIFMGEEVASESPFYFFADFEDARLRRAVDRGRKREYPHAQWHKAVLPSHPDAFHESVFHREDGTALATQPAAQEMFDWYRQLFERRRLWQADGTLDVQSMSVRTDVDRRLFAIEYRANPAAPSNFVIVFVPDDSTTATSTFCIELDGELLLDSQGLATTESTIQMSWQDGPRALIGSGSFNW